jgi:hypothetical protein
LAMMKTRVSADALDAAMMDAQEIRARKNRIKTPGGK